MIGIGATLFKRMAGGSRFSPTSLFSGGEAGVWYDPSDSSTLFRSDSSSDGYLPPVIGEPIELMLDKSQSLKRSPELITNGNFSTDTDWNKADGWSIAGGFAVGTSVAGKNLSQSGVSFVGGATYNIQFTVTRTAGNIIPRIGGTTSVNGATIFSSGTYNIYLTANSTSDALVFRGNAGFTGTIDSVSVKRILGNHASQPVSVNQPIYAREPERGTVNLLEYTEQFDNPYWTKGENTTITANYGTAPDGTQTADRVVMPNSDGTFVTKQTLPVTAGVTYVFSVYARATTGTDNITLSSPQVATDFSLDTNWKRVSVTWTAPATTNIDLSLDNSSSAMDALIWGAQVEESAEATNYQKVVNEYDVTEAGVPSLHYLDFDGVSDSMQIEGLTSSTTPITALFGYSSPTAEAGTRNYLLDIETERTIFAASATQVGNIGYYDGPSWKQFDADSGSLKVLTYDLVEDNAKIRINGLQEYSDTVYSEHSIGGDIRLFSDYVGTNQFTRGRMYQTILRAAESTDTEIANTESFMAKKVGVKAIVDNTATLDLNFTANTYATRNKNGGAQ
jgi:hypothetical protein